MQRRYGRVGLGIVEGWGIFLQEGGFGVRLGIVLILGRVGVRIGWIVVHLLHRWRELCVYPVCGVF